MSLKVWVRGEKERIEMNGGDSTISTYLDYQKDESYIYMNSSKSVVKGTAGSNSGFQSPASFMGTFDKEQLKQYRKIGNETLDGNKCTKYEYKLTGNNDDFIIYLMDSTGLILKYDYLENGTLVSSVYFKNFKLNNVTDDMVTLPKDAVITETGN